MKPMKRKLFVLLLVLVTADVACGQKYISEKSYIRFFSDATLEDITADNKKGSSIFDAASREIVFSIPINEFQFAKSLMQEHFNEKYMESDKFPKSTFQGHIENFDPEARGVQQARAVGKLLIHGETREVEIPGTIEKRGEKLLMKAKFIVRLEDYKIAIPQILWKNIAEQVEVTVEFTYKPK